MNLQFYADKVIVEAESETSNVYAENVDASLIYGQFNLTEVLEFFANNDQFSEIHEFVQKQLMEEE
jgi:hypothetical protein